MFVSAWACSPLPCKPGVCSPAQALSKQVDPSDFFVPHSIQAILLHLHLYWMQNPSRFLLKCAVHDWDLWSLLGQRCKGMFLVLRSIFSCILVHFRLDPESKMFTSLCRIADLFPLTLSLSDMSPSRIHLCCCGKEMKKNLSLNPCMHAPFDFIVCISDW